MLNNKYFIYNFFYYIFIILNIYNYEYFVNDFIKAFILKIIIFFIKNIKIYIIYNIKKINK